ncbi:MAG: radical SAM protein [Actinomycetota bacterium]|nr:radical SAM protein [Actinomycetota bacterium]
MSIRPPVKRPLLIDYWVTGRCNFRCPFCYGAFAPDKTEGTQSLYRVSDNLCRPELSFNQVKGILLKLKKIGVTNVVFSGGEPMIRRDIVDIIKFSHRHFTTYLSTNGYLFFEKYDQIRDSIDSLSIAVDSLNKNVIANLGKNINHIDNVMDILGYFINYKPKHIVKVATMVSQINKKDILEIGNTLCHNQNVYKPNAWRLYQFTPHRKALTVKEKYEIDTNEFLEICHSMKEAFPDIYISGRTVEEMEDGYFFITPDGQMQILLRNEYCTIADLLTIGVNDLIKMLYRYIPEIKKSRKKRGWRKALSPALDQDSSYDESLDLVDDDDIVMGQVSRAAVYGGKKKVRIVNIFLENVQGKIWIPIRNPQKEIYPFCLDNSAGGHVKSGEDYDAAFKREVMEELNIDISRCKWELLGYLKPQVDKVSTFMKVYKIISNTTPDFNRYDFLSGSWMKPSNVMELIRNGQPSKDDLIILMKRFYTQKLSMTV